MDLRLGACLPLVCSTILQPITIIIIIISNILFPAVFQVWASAATSAGRPKFCSLVLYHSHLNEPHVPNPHALPVPDIIIIIITRCSCQEARCVCRQAAVKATKLLPLDVLARSKQDPINDGHGAQYLYRPFPFRGHTILFVLHICLLMSWQKNLSWLQLFGCLSLHQGMPQIADAAFSGFWYRRRLWLIFVPREPSQLCEWAWLFEFHLNQVYGTLCSQGNLIKRFDQDFAALTNVVVTSVQLRIR